MPLALPPHPGAGLQQEAWNGVIPVLILDRTRAAGLEHLLSRLRRTLLILLASLLPRLQERQRASRQFHHGRKFLLSLLS